MKKIILILALISVVIIGCSTEKIVEEVEEDFSANISDNAGGDITENSQPLAEGECVQSWRCISSSIKAWQNADCSFGEKKDCPLGCYNDTCRVKEACDPGIKCRDGNTRGYQLESCQWTNEVDCEWRCEDNACIEMPENYTTNETPENETPEEAAVEPVIVPATPENRLEIGQVKLINVNGNQTELSIYIIEESRVRLKLGTQKSDWLMEGQSGYFSVGVNITVTELLFQPYDGGTKAVVFEVD